MARETEYADAVILALRQKYQEKQTDMDREASMTFSLLPPTDEEKTDNVSEQYAAYRMEGLDAECKLLFDTLKEESVSYYCQRLCFDACLGKFFL